MFGISLSKSFNCGVKGFTDEDYKGTSQKAEYDKNNNFISEMIWFNTGIRSLFVNFINGRRQRVYIESFKKSVKAISRCIIF